MSPCPPSSRLVGEDAVRNTMFERCRDAMPQTQSFETLAPVPVETKHDFLGISAVSLSETSESTWTLAGLNQRCRFYRYQANGVDTFKPHRDDSSPGSGFGRSQRVMRWDAFGGRQTSLMTFLLYLNDDFEGRVPNLHMEILPN